MDFQIRKRINTKGEPRFAVALEVWADGKRRVISGGTFATEREALRAGDRLLSRYETDPARRSALSANQTLSAWIDEWLLSHNVKESTRESYRYRLQIKVLEPLGQLRLNELDPLVLTRWLRSDSSNKYAWPPLRTCIREAVALGILTTDPTANVGIKKTKALKNEEAEEGRVKTWSYEESRLILDASVGHKAEALVVLGIYCGLRPGESMGVRWEDIDFLEGTVKVCRNYTRTASRSFHGSPKTGQSRVVPLPFDAAQRLIRIQETGPRNEGDRKLVYPVNENYTYARTQLGQICRKAGVPQLGPHALRHTCLSTLLNQGVPPAVVAKIAGHSNPRTTLGIYSHAMPEDIDLSRGVIERALGTAASQPLDVVKFDGRPQGMVRESTPQNPTQNPNPKADS